MLSLSLLGAIGPASASAWHLDRSFGRGGIASLAVRENGFGEYGAPYGRVGASALMTPGPNGSVFVGGFARSRRGVFLISRVSAHGTLVRSFGAGGVAAVPAIYDEGRWATTRIHTLAGGRLLIIGLSRSGRDLVAVRLLGNGRMDHSFGQAGVARHPLTGVKGAIVVAQAIESNGDILVLYEHGVATGPGEPAVQAEVGEAPLEMMRLLPSGALDTSFGSGGIAEGAGPPPLVGYPGEGGAGFACGVAAGSDGSAALAFEQVAEITPSGAILGTAPAVQKLDASGSDAPVFGVRGIVMLQASNGSLKCNGLFILPNADLELAFGGFEGAGPIGLFRYTPTGAPDKRFAGSGYTTLPAPAAALNMSPAGETFGVRTDRRSVIVNGILANGRPDSALGGRRGLRVGSGLPVGEDQHAQDVAVELLATNGRLAIRVGSDLLQLTR